MVSTQPSLSEIFFPHAVRRVNHLKDTNGRFVHYTNAEVAASIITNKEIWMRNSFVMNDFMEIEHGHNCLVSAYNGSAGDKFKSVVGSIHPDLCHELKSRFDTWMPNFRNETYLACVSEHREGEDKIGRLSMWRAYGGKAGVAIVLNNKAFFSASNALSATSSPVAYRTTNQFSLLTLKR